MTSLTFFIAPSSQRDVLAALIDLARSGVVSKFAWLEASMDPAGAADSLDPRVVVVDQETIRTSTIVGMVSSHGVDVVRVILVVPLVHAGGDALSSSAEEFYRRIRMPQGTRTEHIRVLVPYSEAPSIEHLGRVGWHDVMLSPESTADPSFPAIAWWSDRESLAGSAAVGLAVHGGIVDSLEEAPTDEYGQDISDDVTVTRVFVRMTDATAIENEMRDKVLRVGQTIPRPRTGSGEMVRPFDDPSAASQDAANKWAKKNQARLISPRLPTPKFRDRRIGLFRALREFFAFMLNVMKGAPAAWLNQRIRSVKATTAEMATHVIYGEGNGIRVVVDGVDSDGNTASFGAIAEKAQEAAARIPPLESSEPSRGHRDLSALWMDLVGVSRSLIDASEYDGLGVKSGQGVVVNAQDVAPSVNGDGTFDFGGRPGASYASGRIESWDQVGADLAQHELEGEALRGEVGSQEASSLLDELRSWRTRNDRRMLPLIGRKFGEWYEQTLFEIRRYDAEIQGLVSSSVDGTAEKQQKKIGRKLRLFLLILVILVAATALVTWFASWGWLIFCAISTGLVGVWFAVAFASFMRNQRQIFALLNYKESADLRVPIVRENLRRALDDLAAIGRAYSQFGCWSRIITAMLEDPFGILSEDSEQPEQHGELPKAVVRQKVSTDEGTIDDKCARLRSLVFGVGWFTRAWGAAARRMGDYLTADQRLILRDGGIVLEQEAGGPGSVLRRWADGLEQEGVHSDYGAELWTQCIDMLRSDPSLDLNLHTLPGQGHHDGGQLRPVSALRQDLERAGDASVVADVLGAGARAGNLHLVDPERRWLRETSRGLNDTVVLVQQTRPVPAHEFCVQVSELPHPPADSWDSDEFDESADGLRY